MARDTENSKEPGLETAKLADTENSAGSDGDSGTQTVQVTQESIDIISQKVDALFTSNVVLIFALFLACGIAAVRTLLKSFEGF